MLQILTTGLTLGVVGSFHCIGMCGPLALSLPVNSGNPFIKFVATLNYNLGRIATYACLGLIVGLIGSSFSMIGFQQWASIIMGAIILTYLIAGRIYGFKKMYFPKMELYFNYIRQALGKLYMKKNISSLFFAGMLNGLLPCGMVYMAIAAGTATGSIVGSAILMGAFGLGTLPAMWAFTFFGNFLAIGFRTKIRKAYPYMLLLIGSLLILRGMGLGIPYISPKMNTRHVEMMECLP